MLIVGCSADSYMPVTVAKLVSPDELPVFTDDLAFEGMSVAIKNQLAVLGKENDRGVLRIGQTSYTTEKLRASLEHFNALISETDECQKEGGTLSQCHDVFAQKIRDQFLVYRLDRALLTAYYTPTIEVSAQRTEKFKYPIYRTPDTMKERHLSRDDIDFGHKLDGKGYELFYAADRFDLYVIDIEGGARIAVNDNGNTSIRYLHYDEDNGKKFTDLSNYMVKEGLLEATDTSRWEQRAVLAAHPDKAREIYASCPGYVFFKVSMAPVVASTGAPLTGNRSMATDPAYYPVKGLIAYVVSPLPLPPPEGTPAESNPRTVRYRTMQRFFIDQDTGNNILGPARADLFFGEGNYAEFLANNLMTKGTIYLLLLK